MMTTLVLTFPGPSLQRVISTCKPSVLQQSMQGCISQLSRELLSFEALSMSTRELMNSVNQYHDQLNQLLEDVPTALRIGSLARPPYSRRRLIHHLHLHFSIYGSLMAIHAHFFYPWMISRHNTDIQDEALEAQTITSRSTVADAARKIILALRLVNSNLTTPSWLAFYYPIYAAINLFIYLVQNPSLPSAMSDLRLLDVCAGHFGFIEFLTSSRVSISLPGMPQTSPQTQLDWQKQWHQSARKQRKRLCRFIRGTTISLSLLMWVMPV